MRRARKAKRRSSSAVQRLYPGKIGKLIMRRARKAKGLSSSALQRLYPGMIGKLTMQRARKAKRLSSSALQRLHLGTIGIPLIFCPAKPRPHATSLFWSLRARKGRSLGASHRRGSLGDCPDHSYLILTTFLTQACAAFGEPFDWDRSRRENLNTDITSDL